MGSTGSPDGDRLGGPRAPPPPTPRHTSETAGGPERRRPPTRGTPRPCCLSTRRRNRWPLPIAGPGARRVDHRPRLSAPATTAAGSSSEGTSPSSLPPAPPSPASARRPTSAPDRGPRGSVRRVLGGPPNQETRTDRAARPRRRADGVRSTATARPTRRRRRPVLRARGLGGRAQALRRGHRRLRSAPRTAPARRLGLARRAQGPVEARRRRTRARGPWLARREARPCTAARARRGRPHPRRTGHRTSDRATARAARGCRTGSARPGRHDRHVASVRTVCDEGASAPAGLGGERAQAPGVKQPHAVAEHALSEVGRPVLGRERLAPRADSLHEQFHRLPPEPHTPKVRHGVRAGQRRSAQSR
jgi:hypothetical protein